MNVVSVQFEPTIWGGEDGSYVLDFARALRVPLAVTLHDVRPDPTPAQRQITKELVDTSEASIVMSNVAASLLASQYGVDRARLDIVPHGVSHLPMVASNTVKPKLGLQGKTVILSFGLIAPGKGFESVIAAMPAVVKAVPTACYVILGATVPETLAESGETYRAALESQVSALGMSDHVKFVDRYVGRVELGTWLEAADIIITPSLNVDRTISGTLAYAMGAGRAIVSTPSLYALELLADGLGRFVAPDSPTAISEALVDLLGDPETRATMGAAVYEKSRGMVWWEVGAQYRRIFLRAADAPRTPRNRPAGRFAAIGA